jgi:hypothetical protein
VLRRYRQSIGTDEVFRPRRISRSPKTPDQIGHSTLCLPCYIFIPLQQATLVSTPKTTLKGKMNSKEAKKHSPTLTRLLKARPAPSRETNLLDAAFSDTKPIKPPPGECCGSSCDPCVMGLYAQELKVWKECAAYRDSVREIAETTPSGDTDAPSCKMPGAFEW